MVFKRKSKSPKKKAYKRKRAYKKRVPRPLGAPCCIVRSAYYADIQPSASVPTYGSIQFKLSDLPDYSEFTNLFDEYCISRVKIHFRPAALTNLTGTSYNNPWFIYVVDKDDAATPTTYDTLMQYPSVRIRSGVRDHMVSFKPRFSVSIYNGVSDAYGSRTGYIDCSNAAVPHYGLKWGIAKAVASTVLYEIWVTYTILLRGVR